MRRNEFLVAALAIGTALPPPAAAQVLTAATQIVPDPAPAARCKLALRIDREVYWRGLYGRGYEAASPTTFEPGLVTVSHQGKACVFFLAVSGVDAGLRGPGGRLVYDVLDAPSGRPVSSPDPLGTAQTRLIGAFREGEEMQASPLFVSIRPGQWVHGGDYAGQAMVSLYLDDGGLPVLVEQAPMPIAAPVPPVLSVSSDFFSGMHSASLDLGRLDDGATATVDFTVTANMRVSVGVVSAGKGMLRHKAGLTIPYRASLAGRPLALAGGGASERFDVAAGMPVDVPLDIRVDPPRGAGAGNYSDTLTITFRAD